MGYQIFKKPKGGNRVGYKHKVSLSLSIMYHNQGMDAKTATDEALRLIQCYGADTAFAIARKQTTEWMVMSEILERETREMEKLEEANNDA